jgi:hypothetical protein
VLLRRALVRSCWACKERQRTAPVVVDSGAWLIVGVALLRILNTVFLQHSLSVFLFELCVFRSVYCCCGFVLERGSLA